MPDLRPLAPRRIALLLREAWYNLNQTFRRQIAEHGLTPDQFTILRWLHEHPDGLTQRALADLMSSDPNTITSVLTRMEDGNLIARAAHEHDRRCHRIDLRPAGREIYARLQPLAVALQEEILSAIPLAQRAQFLDHLATLATACQQAARTTKARRKVQ